MPYYLLCIMNGYMNVRYVGALNYRHRCSKYVSGFVQSGACAHALSPFIPVCALCVWYMTADTAPSDTMTATTQGTTRQLNPAAVIVLTVVVVCVLLLATAVVVVIIVMAVILRKGKSSGECI